MASIDFLNVTIRSHTSFPQFQNIIIQQVLIDLDRKFIDA